MAKIVYHVSQALADQHKVISRLDVCDPYLALADILAKVEAPIPRYFMDIPPRTHFANCYTRIPDELSGSPGYLHARVEGYHAFEKRLLYSISLTTHLRSRPRCEGIQGGSDPYYLSKEYTRWLDALRDALREWSHDRIQSAEALCAMACHDLYHAFWAKPPKAKKPAQYNF